jgi:rSAM/selenodomain-associated transferase 1
VSARIARAFLLDTVVRLGQVPTRRVLAFAPPESREAFTELIQGRFELTPQQDGDLGRRMSAFLAGQFAAGATAVVLVGTDSPTLPVSYVEQAFRELESNDVVLGPATDGGYYLIGCSHRVSPCFDGVSWGTSRVLGETVARLAGQRLALLPPWYDVDTLDDWTTLQGHLAALRRAGLDPGVPHTEALATGRPLV